MLLMGIIPLLTRDIAFISQGRETKKPRSLAGLDSRFSEGSASIGAGTVGRISVVRGRLVRAIVCIVTDAIRVHVAHSAIAAERVRHDQGECIARAAIGIGGGH